MHIPQAVTANGRPQPRVGAINFVAGHPRRGDLGGHRAVDQRCGQGSVSSRNPAYHRGFRHSCSGRGPRPMIAVHIEHDRSARARARPRTSDTPPLESSRCGPRCRCTDAAPRRCALPFFTSPVSSTTKIASGIPEGIDDVVTQIVTNSLGVPFRPRQQMLQPIRGGRDRGARRSSSNSCGPNPRPSQPSARQHAARGSKRAKSRRDPIQSPPRTLPATDQGLRYEPRRPRLILLSSQTPNNAAVTALTSADTPQQPNHNLRLQY